jgi:diguanylate cyclase (GGDEF)-like protein/PAS domain S-box-containing protein
VQTHHESIPIAEAIFERSAEAIMITDANMRIVKVNPSFTAITGYEASEVVGLYPDVFKSTDRKICLYQEIRKILHNNQHWEGEISSQRKNGESYPQWVSVTAIRDAHGSIQSYISIFSDMTERKRTESHIRYLTDYDALTGLPNRFSLLRQLDELLPVIIKQNKVAALLFLDIDHFKTVINSLGHSVGDKILLQIAELLTNSLGAGDITARLGGDEFAIVLTNLGDNRDTALQVIKQYEAKLRRILSKPITLMEHTIVITCSIGGVFFPIDADTSEQLFKLADAALHRAKQEDNNQTQFITPDIAQNANRRMILLSALNFALPLGEFVLLFQPQFNELHQLISAEALLRWEPNGQTMVYPDEFIPLAEENGTIIAIGEWILRVVAQHIKIWITQGMLKPNQSIAVNISPKQFAQTNFVSVVSDIVTEAGIAPYNLELELTEGLLIKNVDESVSKLEALKALGFRISIDDFGTGYSSLAYLKRFPLNTLKIDRSFVTAVDSDASNAGIVQAIIAMAKALKFDTVAEGVETQAEFNFLKEHHCNLYQGYFFSNPLRFHEFEQLLSANSLLFHPTLMAKNLQTETLVL